MVDGVFVGLSVITIGSAIISLESRELLYGGIALAVSMLGIAGYFIILDAPFVAMFQIAVYVGAVAVFIIFTVMLVRSPNTVTKKETRKKKDCRYFAWIGISCFSRIHIRKFCCNSTEI